jgi:hypothetical protein
MPPPLLDSIAAITKYLERWVPGVSVRALGGNFTAIEVTYGSKQAVLRYGPELDVLERTLKDERLPSLYRNGVIRDFTLGALISIGKEGMAPEVDVSKLILDEELEWNRRVNLMAAFDATTAKKLYEGLKTLDALAKDLTGADVVIPEIESERTVMASMIAHYESTGSLNADASGESLSYLKAAALVWILELEDQKRASTSPRIRAARSVRLFELLEEYWKLQPWHRIPMPPIVRDYVEHRAAAAKSAPTGPGPSLDIGPQLKQLDPRLERRWRGAWDALRSKNSDKVSQAANSMVEVLNQVIDRVCDGREFKDVLAERCPKQEEVVLAKRKYISELKSSLQSVKHETNQQAVDTAEDLMHAVEGIIRTLLR